MVPILKRALSLLALFFLFVVITHFFPVPCIFYRLTGWKCPGCGMTRAVFSLLQFHFLEAFLYNPFCYVLVVFVFQYCLFGKISFKKWQSTVLLVIVLLFGIGRNFI